jgi:hypothetical protein
MRETLPPIDKFLPFQTQSLLFIDSMIGNQVDFLLGFAPTEIPRKRKGIESTPQCKKEEDARKNLSSRFMP